ncbi:MAG: hypothetical protein QOE89_1966 [Pseudonocardiales bacterium]|nr:hypothetical protein [Pseudonocardiales bacterium]
MKVTAAAGAAPQGRPAVVARRPRVANTAAVLAAVWAGLFGVAHGYWALGGTGLRPPGIRTGEWRTLLIVESLAVVASLVGVVLAVRLARGGYQRWLFVLAATGASLMLWHASLNYLFLGARSALGQPVTPDDRYYAFGYEPLWLIGGVLWLVAVFRFRAGRSALHRLSPGTSQIALDFAQHS